MKATKLHEGRRTKKTKKTGLIAIITIAILILVLVIILVLTEKRRTEKTLEGEEPPAEEEVVISKDHSDQIEMVDVSDMPDSMGGYTVIGKIVIDKLGVQKYILGRSTDESLNLAVAKFWGPHINDPR